MKYIKKDELASCTGKEGKRSLVAVDGKVSLAHGLSTLTLQKTSSGNAKKRMKQGRAELFLDRSL
ncbi:MAG: hypothetical protein JXA30_13865, partial [Deltaproteobacteria bacterium]|nr:hypothetical protein [Deltaproteobacteria bacterium]